MNIGIDMLVAAADSTEKARKLADFICTGSHDELILQKAMDVCMETRQNLVLADGVYNIDGFRSYGDGGPKTALRVPNRWRELAIIGQNTEYGLQKDYRNGVVFRLSAEALETIGNEEADVLRSGWCECGIQDGASLRLENIAIVLENNRHALRCIDLRRTDRAELKNISLFGYGDFFRTIGEKGLGVQPPLATKGCIGLTMTDGSNYNFSNYVNVFAYGFDEAIQVGGEHVVCINCGATSSRYGYTFGNYQFSCGFNHPIVMINCLDERNVNLPLFNRCGDHDCNGKPLHGLQEVTMIAWNIERNPDITPGGKLGDKMREVNPGTWRGNIGFTFQPAWCHCNAEDADIWEHDGSGTGFVTRNNAHKAICTTAERLAYVPSYGEQLFDTDLNKLVICVDTASRKWVDCMGSQV